MHAYTSVVFDLDGTLIDSSPDIAAALNSVLVPAGGRELSPAETMPLLGEGPRRLVEGALTLSGAVAPNDSASVLDEYVHTYLAAYRASPAELSSVYPRLRDALEDLMTAGVPMGVCTNKNQELSEVVLDKLGLAGYFSAVVGADSVPASKPDPGHLLTTFRHLGTSPLTGLYVGDSVIDEATARAAAVDFAAVSWAPPEIEAPRLDTYAALPAMVLEMT